MDLIQKNLELNICQNLLTSCKLRSLNHSRPNPDEEKKNNLFFYFHTSCGASKSFMKALKTFTKPFEAPQGSVKIEV